MMNIVLVDDGEDDDEVKRIPSPSLHYIQVITGPL